jgi:hypothetical protein
MTKFKNIAIAVASLVIFTNITNAQTVVATNYQVAYSEPFTVKYLGTDGNYLLFEVNLKSDFAGQAKFKVEDKDAGPLYYNNFKSNFNIKTLKVEKKDAQELDFIVTLNKTTYSKSFSISTSQVENVTVSEKDITRL